MTIDIYAQQNGLVGRANASAPLDGPVIAGMPRGLGTQVNQCANRLKAVWNFNVLGGAAGDIFLLDDQGNPAILPLGAIVIKFLANTVVAPAGGTSIAAELLVAADLMAATPIADFVPGGVWSGKPTSAASSAAVSVGPVVAKLGTQVRINLVGTMTAGLINFDIDYIDAN